MVTDALGRPGAVLLVGGSSEIGLAVVRAVAAGRDCRIVLAGRDRSRTLEAAGTLPGRCTFTRFDALDPATHGECVKAAWADGDVDLVVVAHGVLGDNETGWRDPEEARRLATVNYTSAIAVLAAAADQILRQGHGTIVVMSSVAGERARRSNFVYGSTKAGLDAYATGLGEALRPHGGHVLVVRPGFVRSRMTAELDPAPLSTTPTAVGSAVAAAIRSGRSEIWVPASLRFVMAALRHLPGPLFRRLPL